MPAKIYDWDKWFARRRFRLLRGTHYFCSQSTMSQQIRNAATKRGLQVSITEGKGPMYVDMIQVKVTGTSEPLEKVAA